MSTFARPAAEAVRRLAPVDAATVGAELNNIACAAWQLEVTPACERELAGLVAALHDLANTLRGANDAHDLADIHRDPEGVVEAMGERGVR